MELISLPIIASIVYSILQFYRSAIKNQECFIKWIPLIAPLLGACVSIIIFYCFPDIIIGDVWYHALGIGLSSGFAATGIHQVGKQLLTIESNEVKKDD